MGRIKSTGVRYRVTPNDAAAVKVIMTAMPTNGMIVTFRLNSTTRPTTDNASST